MKNNFKPQKMHYKERKPVETVNFIKKILVDNNIQMVEEWQDKSSVGTFALRLLIKGTEYGANGKGITREYAEASAYAEFVERLQNDLLGDLNVTTFKSDYTFKIYFDEEIKSAKDLIEDNNEYIKMYFRNRNLENISIDKKVEEFVKIQRLDNIFYNSQDYLSIPYYSYNEKRIVYLPRNVYRLSYGSNGMSAGNTFEEAVVQGLSEIIERYVQKRILKEHICLPDIPNECINKYPHIKEMLDKLKKKDEYEIMLKDCSLGGKYPVAALVILEKNTGRYGVKLGCHPDYGIAMERTFTEAAQGQDILLYSQRSTVDFYNKNVSDDMNIYNTYKIGLGQFPYQVLKSSVPTYSFKEVIDVANYTNKEMMNYWCKKLIDDGYDILIRDVSYSGFPSVHIIIPGMSEMFVADDRRYRIYNTRFFVCELLKNPKKINSSNAKYIISVLEYFIPSVMENTIDTYYDWVYNGKIPGEEFGMGIVYLIAMCYILLEDYKNAVRNLKIMLQQIDEILKEDISKEKEAAFYKAVFYFVSALDAGLDKMEIQKYIMLMFDEEICQKVSILFENVNDVIALQYEGIDTQLKNTSQEKLQKVRESFKKMQLNNKINQIIIRKKIEV